jgi:hypothetical protein
MHRDIISDKITRLAKEKCSAAYDIHELKGFRPSIRISGISRDLTKDSLLTYLAK